MLGYKNIPVDPMTLKIADNSELPSNEIPMLMPVVWQGKPFFISFHEVSGKVLIRDVVQWDKEKQAAA